MSVGQQQPNSDSMNRPLERSFLKERRSTYTHQSGTHFMLIIEVVLNQSLGDCVKRGLTTVFEKLCTLRCQINVTDATKVVEWTNVPAVYLVELSKSVPNKSDAMRKLAENN